MRPNRRVAPRRAAHSRTSRAAFRQQHLPQGDGQCRVNACPANAAWADHQHGSDPMCVRAKLCFPCASKTHTKVDADDRPHPPPHACRSTKWRASCEGGGAPPPGPLRRARGRPCLRAAQLGLPARRGWAASSAASRWRSVACRRRPVASPNGLLSSRLHCVFPLHPSRLPLPLRSHPLPAAPARPLSARSLLPRSKLTPLLECVDNRRQCSAQGHSHRGGREETVLCARTTRAQLFSGRPEGQVVPCTGASSRCTSCRAAASASACGDGARPSPCSTASTLSRTCGVQQGEEAGSGRARCSTLTAWCETSTHQRSTSCHGLRPALPTHTSSCPAPAAACRSPPGGWRWRGPAPPPSARAWAG